MSRIVCGLLSRSSSRWAHATSVCLPNRSARGRLSPSRDRRRRERERWRAHEMYFCTFMKEEVQERAPRARPLLFFAWALCSISSSLFLSLSHSLSIRDLAVWERSEMGKEEERERDRQRSCRYKKGDKTIHALCRIRTRAQGLLISRGCACGILDIPVR